jgi:hypothetical protein
MHTLAGNHNPVDMSFEYFKSVVDRNTFGATIMPYMNNEPLLHPDITRMMEYVISKGQRCYITTNGTIWNEDLFKLITEKNSFYQIIFSLDGLWNNTIEKCRPGSNKYILLNYIERFKKLKEEKGNNLDMCLKICRRGQDWEEIENFIYFWLKDEIDYICIGNMLNQVGIEVRKYPCQYFDDKFLLIKANKHIVPCMYNTIVYFVNYFNIGKLNETENLIDAYNRPVLQKLREDQNNGIFHGPCKSCNSAYTGQGFRAQYEFNDPGKKEIGTLYGSYDYYNMTFSLKDKPMGVQYGNI